MRSSKPFHKRSIHYIHLLYPIKPSISRMIPWWDWSYRRVSSDSPVEKQSETIDDENERQPERIQQYRRITHAIRNIIVYLFVVVCGVAILVVVSLYEFRAKNNVPTRLCGNSSVEALSLGCTFDQLTWAWYPPSCPHYANNEFLDAEQWHYYDDPHSMVPVAGENWTRALDNQQDLWGERREHLTHCVYVFLSLGQIIRDGTPYAPKLVRYEHLHHCSTILLESLRQDPNWHNLETLVGKASYDEYC